MHAFQTRKTCNGKPKGNLLITLCLTRILSHLLFDESLCQGRKILFFFFVLCVPIFVVLLTTYASLPYHVKLLTTVFCVTRRHSNNICLMCVQLTSLLNYNRTQMLFSDSHVMKWDDLFFCFHVHFGEFFIYMYIK